ncbi:MAG: triose-phosphate isomerase [Candidatus Berkelbacteria bacterium]|nr:triose-phosphate isomerase [Candidatus Berkelbacteria bacterium]
MRRPLVVANWKMNTNLSDAIVLATAIRDGVENISGVEVVICPPAIWLVEVSQIIHKEIGHLGLGAQNIHYMPDGSYTGEISAGMVRDVAKYVILGHSERRKNFAETNDIIARKTAVALDTGLIPIICVGEEKKSQNSVSEVVTQLKESLFGINKNELDQIIVAYEPVRAVGAEEPATPEHSARVIDQLREVLSIQTPILYGGAINAGNIYSFVQRPEIDGVLVGRDSLNAPGFIKICRIVSEYKRMV